jgi:PPOX class probable F420-dependent enzyme
MAAIIPEKYLDLFQKKAFANLATIMPDGSPQVTPVWVDYDGNHVLVNTARGRQKDKNMQRDTKVSLAILDPDNPYRYLEIRGTVTDVTEQGADAHIDKMAMKYMGKDKYPYRNPSEKRVIFKIQPTKTTQMG